MRKCLFPAFLTPVSRESLLLNLRASHVTMIASRLRNSRRPPSRTREPQKTPTTGALRHGEIPIHFTRVWNCDFLRASARGPRKARFWLSGVVVSVVGFLL